MMTKQLRQHYEGVVNGKRRWFEDGGMLATVTDHADGFKMATKTEKNRRGEFATNVLFVVSPNLYAMLEKAGYISEPTDPWENAQ